MVCRHSGLSRSRHTAGARCPIAVASHLPAIRLDDVETVLDVVDVDQPTVRERVAPPRADPRTADGRRVVTRRRRRVGRIRKVDHVEAVAIGGHVGGAAADEHVVCAESGDGIEVPLLDRVRRVFAAAKCRFTG